MTKLLQSALSSAIVRFLAVGGLSYLVNQAALLLLYEHTLTSLSRSDSTWLGHIDLGLLVASAVAVEVSILFRFVLNDRWTFRDRCQKPLLVRFYQSNVSSFGSPLISLACVNLLTPLLGISYLVANSLGVLLGLAWNWTWSNRVVWRGNASIPAQQPSMKVAEVNR